MIDEGEVCFSVEQVLKVNEGKQGEVSCAQGKFHCYALKTRLVQVNDDLATVIREDVKPHVQPGDIVFASEKMLACTQGRAFPLDSIKVGFWARTLSKYVVKTPTGIGLGMPETMQCAINECGLPRILLASAAGAIGKVLGKKGWFYHVAGYKAAAVDGPCHWTIPPYNHYVVLAPENPDGVSKDISDVLGGNPVLAVDLNDLGGKILGRHNCDIPDEELLKLLGQNPLGQTDECTPVGILRPVQE